MKSIKQIIRLMQINHTLAKNGLDKLIVSLRLFAPIRFIVYLNPWNWCRQKPLTRGEALRKSLEALGPIFVKFGQALSTRPDILPPDIALELAKLQDQVAPFSSDSAIKILELALKKPTQDLFASFDPQPLASASMAQVHAATLHSGESVVVKILRPNMRHIIEQDLSILHTIARLAERYWPECRRLKPREIVTEFEHSLIDELDLQREAANGSQLRRNFQNSPLLYVPVIYWDYTRENILVMERIHGIPVADIAQLKQHHINIKKLAERGLEIFFLQVFRDCFFHADMHPGNIFVSSAHPDNPQYICIDYGIIGTLNDHDKRYIAENLIAFFNQDYRQVAKLHVESGWVARNTRVEVFESAIRTVCEPIFQKPLKDISFALVVLRLFQVAQRFQMEVQPQLILLQKTLLAVEGLGRQLDPELDLWATAKPFLEKWLKQQISPSALFKQVQANIPFFIEQLPHLPQLVNDVLLLNKERQLSSIEQQTMDQSARAMQHSPYKIIGLTLLITMTAISSNHYYHYLSNEQLSQVTLSTALIGGLLAIINWRR